MRCYSGRGPTGACPKPNRIKSSKGALLPTVVTRPGSLGKDGVTPSLCSSIFFGIVASTIATCGNSPGSMAVTSFANRRWDRRRLLRRCRVSSSTNEQQLAACCTACLSLAPSQSGIIVSSFHLKQQRVLGTWRQEQGYIAPTTCCGASEVGHLWGEIDCM